MHRKVLRASSPIKPVSELHRAQHSDEVDSGREGESWTQKCSSASGSECEKGNGVWREVEKAEAEGQHWWTWQGWEGQWRW